MATVAQDTNTIGGMLPVPLRSLGLVFQISLGGALGEQGERDEHPFQS